MKDSVPKRRNSVRRERILEELRKSRQHPTAEWIYHRLKKEFPGLSLGTVYRNLKILAEEKLIQTIQNGSTFDRYDGNLAPHHHLICECCGTLADMEWEMDPSFIQQLEKQSGFQLRPYPIEMWGLCPKCQAGKLEEEHKKQSHLSEY